MQNVVILKQFQQASKPINYGSFYH